MGLYNVPQLSDFEWQKAVLDKDLNTPPVSPTKGDRYIVGSSPTDAWSGQSKKITYWSGSAWIFITATEGYSVWVKDEDKFYKYDGTNWLEIFNLITSPGVDHFASGIIASFTANENQSFGDICYIDSDGEMHLANADVIATAIVVGMCIDSSISANNAGNYLLQGIARDDTWSWTVGGVIFLSTTGTSGNTLTQVAPSGVDDSVVVVGVATNIHRMIFNPSYQGIIEHV